MTEEGHHRNLVLETLHNTKLPSYAVWTHDDIERIDVFTNLEWWEGTQKAFIKKNTKNPEIKKIITQWSNYYKYMIDHPKEYCSKRMPDYLYCDI